MITFGLKDVSVWLQMWSFWLKKLRLFFGLNHVWLAVCFTTWMVHWSFFPSYKPCMPRIKIETGAFWNHMKGVCMILFITFCFQFIKFTPGKLSVKKNEWIQHFYFSLFCSIFCFVCVSVLREGKVTKKKIRKCITYGI